jgi:DNA repair exonuclease SbcCD ATPase subunit
VSKKEDADYKEWLEELKTKNPAISEHLDAIAETDQGRDLFRGERREADYYRRLNELDGQKKAVAEEAEINKAEGARQVSWWQAAKPEYEEALKAKTDLTAQLEAAQAKLKEQGVPIVDPTTPKPPPAPAPETTKEIEAMKARINAMDAGYPQVMLGLFQAQQAAQAEGIPFDAGAVLKHAYDNNTSPMQSFNTLSSEVREKNAAEKLTAKLDEAREAGRKEALSKLSGPDRGIRPSGPTIVDALRGDAEVLTDSDKRKDAAVRDWMEMESQGQT